MWKTIKKMGPFPFWEGLKQRKGMEKIKNVKIAALLVSMVLVLTACSGGASKGETWDVEKSFSCQEIAKWETMKTPNQGSGSGSVTEENTEDGFVTIKAADDGWGGLESEYIELDLDKDPMVLIKVFENPDGSNWGLKVVPENPIEDHAWGMYLIPDNNLKWNKYAGVDVNSVLDDDFKAIYGSKFKVKLWVFAAGGPESTVSVSEIKVLNTK